MCAESNNDKKSRRSMTELTLGWIAERLRKAERIKEEIKSGAYKVNSEAIAQAIIGVDKNKH